MDGLFLMNPLSLIINIASFSKYLHFSLRFYFLLSNFRCAAKEEMQRFPIYLCPHTYLASSIINILPQRGTFFATYIYTLWSARVHNLPENSLFLLYILCITAIIFKQMHNCHNFFPVFQLFIPFPFPHSGKHWSV